jgi:hypothetical protein
MTGCCNILECNFLCITSLGTYTEGSYVYEGEFHEDEITGNGKFRYASGAAYEGEWELGKYQGRGKFSWPDGRMYEVSGNKGNEGFEG